MTLPGYKYVSPDRDRHGNVRWYFRRPGQPKIRLHGEPDTDAFREAYKAAMAGLISGKAPRKSGAPARGSLRWLCVEYFGSALFRKGLGAGTQRVRRRILEGVCQTAGDVPFKDITPVVIRKGIDRRADKPEAANAFVKAMSALFKFAIKYEHATVNPTVGVDRLRSDNPDGWHTWTLDEVRQFEAMHPVGSKARLALALLLFTGTRRSDVIKLGRQHVRDGWLHFRVTKNSRTVQYVDVDIPILAELQHVIDATPEKGDLAFLVHDHGQPWKSGDSFGNRFRDWCVQAGLPHCSPHGLRKAGATIAANNGATERQLDAIYGWTDPKMAARYTRKVNRKRLAGDAMPLIELDQKSNELSHRESPVAASGAISPKKERKINAL